MINAIETTTDVNVTDSLFHNNDVDDDDNVGGGEKDNEGEKNAIVGGKNSSSTADSQRQCGKFSKRQISRELFVVNRDANSNQCDKSDNDNGSHVGGNCELNKGQIQTPTTTTTTVRSGNRKKIFLDTSFGFENAESPRILASDGLSSSTPTTAASNITVKYNRSIDEMSTPNSSFYFNNTTRSSFGGNSSRKSFECSGGGKNNNSISRRNTSSPLCLGDFINTSGTSSSGKQGTAAAAIAGEYGENLI